MGLFAKSTLNNYFISIILIAVVVLLRFAVGGFNWSYFIVLGDNFATPSINPTEIIQQDGPGYDGQFYYGLAKDPFSFEKVKGGVIIDHPPYRHQRILYPLLAYYISFRGKSILPLIMVIINGISLFLISRIIASFQFISTVKWRFLLPLLISGLWMSLSRNLTECLEVLFLILVLQSFLRHKIGYYILFSSAALLTRETTIIYIGTIAAIWLWRYMSGNSKRKLLCILLLGSPFLVLAVWKYILLQAYPASGIVSAGSNITFPFHGIIMSFLVNLKHIDSTRSLIEFMVWSTFLIWQFALFFLGIRAMQFNFNTQIIRSTLSSLCLIGIGFASLFSISIYIDDWAFLRILSGLDVFLFLLILERKGKLPKWLLMSTAALALITVVRIILRV